MPPKLTPDQQARWTDWNLKREAAIARYRQQHPGDTDGAAALAWRLHQEGGVYLRKLRAEGQSRPGPRSAPRPKPKPKPRAASSRTRAKSSGTGWSGGGTTHVGGYVKSDGTRVRAHDRNAAWRQAGAAWGSAGASGLVSLGLVMELGFTIVSALAMILTAAVAALAVMLSDRASGGPKRRKGRARATATQATRRR